MVPLSRRLVKALIGRSGTIGTLAMAATVVAGSFPASASAAESNQVDLNQASLNLGEMGRYSGKVGAEQVTSINQFSDVRPTDWAYQALSNLVERYGCVAGYPEGSFKGGHSISRYEAAALLNACLDRISEVTDELKKLMAEFEKELAVLRGRVDGLDARVGELEATQFSTTTRLRGDSRWVLGGLDYSGSTANYPEYTDRSNPYFVPLREALAFNYDVRLNFDTSFSGKDLLRTQLRAGNFADSGFGAPPTPLTQLDAGFQENCGTGTDCGDVVAINRLYYRFPIGRDFTAVVAPRGRQDDMLPIWPSLYSADKILKIFQYSGAPGAYSQVLGAGGGLWWKQGGKSTGWSLGVAYVAGNGDVAVPAEGGIATQGSAASSTVQLAYTGTNWNLTGAFTRNGANVRYPGTPLAVEQLPTIGFDNGYTNSFALSGYWQPFFRGWFPSISAGWGLNRITYTDKNTVLIPDDQGYKGASQSWYLGLVWSDVLAKGNALGFAIGQAPMSTNPDGDTVCQTWNPPVCRSTDPRTLAFNAYHEPEDQGLSYELYYKIQLTDNIVITPAVFWLDRPQGQYTLKSGPDVQNDGTLGVFGGLVQATFHF